LTAFLSQQLPLIQREVFKPKQVHRGFLGGFKKCKFASKNAGKSKNILKWEPAGIRLDREDQSPSFLSPTPTLFFLICQSAYHVLPLAGAQLIRIRIFYAVGEWPLRITSDIE
jgi:hypothetical protein